MNNQEGSEMMQQLQKKQEDFEELVEPFDNSFSMLRLNSTNDNHKHNHKHHSPCTTCGCGSSKKRRSPSSSSSKSKKPFLLEQDDPTTTLHGFSKILLPITTLSTPSPPPQPQPQPQPLLRRCISDTSNVVIGTPMTELPLVFGSNLAPHSPDQTAKTCVNVINPSTPSSNIRLPPLPPPLRRTISDPSPSPVKSFSRSSTSKEETPNSKKRLRRMKERMTEMSGWCGELMCEQEEEDELEEDGGAEDNINAATKV